MQCCSFSSSEPVECPSLPLQGVDHVHRRHGLPLGVLRVGHRVADDVLQEHLEDTPGLLVDQTRDPLYTPTTGKTTNGRLSDALKKRK